MTSATFIFGFNAKAVEMGMARLKSSVSSFGKSFAGMLAGGLAIGSIVQGFRTAVAEGAKLQDLSDRFGLPASEIGRFAAAGKEMGVTTEDVAKSLAKLAVNQTKALQGNDGLLDTFQSVGISMEDLANKSPTELMNQIADAFKNGAVSGDEMAVAMELLGKGGINMVGMLRQGSDEISRIAEEMGYFDDETVAALDAADDAISKLSTQATLVFGQVASAIAPAVQALADLVKTLNEMGALLPVLGAVTGFMMGGPVGAAIGATAGLALQASTGKDKNKKKEQKTSPQEYTTDPETGERVQIKRGRKKPEANASKEMPQLSDRDQNAIALKQNQNKEYANKIAELKSRKANLPLGEKGKLKLDNEIMETQEKIFKNEDDISKLQEGGVGKKRKSVRGASVEDYDGGMASFDSPSGGIMEQASKIKEGAGKMSGGGGSAGSSRREMQGVGVTEKLDKIYGVLTEIKNQNNTFN